MLAFNILLTFFGNNCIRVKYSGSAVVAAISAAVDGRGLLYYITEITEQIGASDVSNTGNSSRSDEG